MNKNTVFFDSDQSSLGSIANYLVLDVNKTGHVGMVGGLHPPVFPLSQSCVKSCINWTLKLYKYTSLFFNPEFLFCILRNDHFIGISGVDFWDIWRGLCKFTRRIGLSHADNVRKSSVFLFIWDDVLYLPYKSGNTNHELPPVDIIMSMSIVRATTRVVITDGSGFRHLTIKKGQEFQLKNLQLNYFLCVLNGECCLQSQTYTSRILKQEEMIILHRMEYYMGKASEDLNLFILGVPPSFYDTEIGISDEYTDSASSLCYDFRPTPIKKPLFSMLKLLHDYQQQGFDNEYLQELKRREFLLLIRELYSKIEIIGLIHPLIGESLYFRNKILSSYRNTLSVSDLICISGFSRSGFFVRFKHEFGMTAKEWLADRIKQDIISLAANRQLSVKEIMLSLNFDSLQQFNRFCKRNFGLPPVRFVESIREQIDEKHRKK